MPLHVAYFIAATRYWWRCICLLKRLRNISRNTHVHTNYCVNMTGLVVAAALRAQIDFTWICVCQSVPPSVLVSSNCELLCSDWIWLILFMIYNWQNKCFTAKGAYLEVSNIFLSPYFKWNGILHESLVTDKVCVDVSNVTVLLRVTNYDSNTKTHTLLLLLLLLLLKITELTKKFFPGSVATNRNCEMAIWKLGPSDYTMLTIYIHLHNMYLYTGNLGVR